MYHRQDSPRLMTHLFSSSRSDVQFSFLSGIQSFLTQSTRAQAQDLLRLHIITKKPFIFLLLLTLFSCEKNSTHVQNKTKANQNENPTRLKRWMIKSGNIGVAVVACLPMSRIKIKHRQELPQNINT